MILIGVYGLIYTMMSLTQQNKKEKYIFYIEHKVPTMIVGFYSLIMSGIAYGHHYKLINKFP